MRSHHLRLEQYDSDKIESSYLAAYDPFFTPIAECPVRLLELGVLRGGSLRLWHDYFPSGTIAGVDLNLLPDFPVTDRIHLFQGSQADTTFLSKVAARIAPEGFDIIIDDASHFGDLTKIAFWHLFENHLKPGGLYVIEDWGTGYWSDWPDGKRLDLSTYSRVPSRWDAIWRRFVRRLRFKRPYRCHSHGMVGFVKQLVDEQGASDVTRGSVKGKATRSSKFQSVTILPSLVFVRKASVNQPSPTV